MYVATVIYYVVSHKHCTVSIVTLGLLNFTCSVLVPSCYSADLVLGVKYFEKYLNTNTNTLKT